MPMRIPHGCTLAADQSDTAATAFVYYTQVLAVSCRIFPYMSFTVIEFTAAFTDDYVDIASVAERKNAESLECDRVLPG